MVFHFLALCIYMYLCNYILICSPLQAVPGCLSVVVHCCCSVQQPCPFQCGIFYTPSPHHFHMVALGIFKIRKQCEFSPQFWDDQPVCIWQNMAALWKSRESNPSQFIKIDESLTSMHLSFFFMWSFSRLKLLNSVKVVLGIGKNDIQSYLPSSVAETTKLP